MAAEFTVNAKSFVETIQVLSSIIHSKESELVKKQVAIRVEEGSVVLRTINESTMLRVQCDAEDTSLGIMCIDVYYLSSLLAKFSGDVKFKRDGNAITIKSGRSKYKTSSFPIEEFEGLLDLENQVAFTEEPILVELAPLKNALSCVNSSASKEDAALSSAYIKNDFLIDKCLVVCSNAELGAVVIKDDFQLPTGPLPRFIVDFIMKLKGVRFLKYQMSEDGLFRGEADKFSFIYRSPDFEYPWESMRGFIETHAELPKNFKFNKKDAVDALSRIGVVTDNATHAVNITFTGGSMIISAEGPGSQGVETVTLIEEATEDYSILVDCYYLMQVLKEHEGAVQWSCTNSDSPQFISDGYLVKFFMGLVE